MKNNLGLFPDKDGLLLNNGRLLSFCDAAYHIIVVDA